MRNKYSIEREKLKNEVRKRLREIEVIINVDEIRTPRFNPDLHDALTMLMCALSQLFPVSDFDPLI